ncbi:receptor-type tyrosine-protein phosphatase F-like isoform X2 [Acanthaster planci]|uniref:protein-tyrosine-phosphatase n=1 Tax=Acanthaster planci TaxID=133434 RepID=A0A8B7Y7P5_ACAPL|nr:receptor-type tyrosine-protein phosphatase F-like isoform X2 [Acanthaster planci]
MRCGPTGLTVMMANFTRLYFLVAAVVLCWLASRCLQGISAIDDFTCITKPRIDFDNEDTYIAAYLHGGSATLSFARTTFTRTGGDDPGQLDLPRDNQPEPASSLEGDEISILRLPSNGGKTRIGFFACKKGDDVSIGTAIMSRNAYYLPTFPSHTVNNGDSVTLTVNATNTSFTATRWRKNGEGSPGLIDTPEKVIDSADESDSGTYEIHLTKVRSAGQQALIRLFVRECEENKWSTPSCDKVCKVCFNGGVCEVASGVCICPPGFSGDFCEILLGPDRFGQDGSFRCSSSELLGSTCEGKLFCLPDPYGCSCASGYRGIDCNQGCPDGSFGASCLQTCHCMDDAPCNKTTGRCPGNCASGFKGINCQDGCPEGHGGLADDCSTLCTVPAEVTELQDVTPLSLSANQIHLSWKFVSNRCAVTRYQVQYELTNLEQCQPMAPNRIDVGGDSYYGDSLTISSGVRPYSSYTVYVRAWNEVGPGSEMPLYVRTGESVPSVAPVYNGSSISSDSITFYWEPIPCGSRGGDITGYDYEVQDSTGTRIGDRQSVQTEMVEVSGLTPCMRYTFRVRAQTNGGPGPWTNPIQVPGLLDQFLVDRTTEPTEIRVTWQEPSNVGNCPVQYTVEYSLIKRGLCERIDSPSRQVWSGDTRPPVTIRELHPRSLYHVYVRASTTTGPGMVAEGEAVTSERTSSVAPVITGHNSSSDSITFYWEPIPCENRSGNITGYDYEVQDSRGAMIRDRQSVQTEMVVVSELTPCMRYTFRVRAVNSVGLLGTWTEGMEVETSARGGVAQDAGRIDDFTCITKPRIDFDNEDTYIAAYLHGGSAALSFARTTFTRTGTSGEQKPSPLKLPPNHDILMLQSSEEGFSILQLPAVTNRKKRIGFFACRKNGGNVMSIGTAIMSRNADFLPTFPSWTVNRGNNVTLMVNASSSSRTQTRWRRNAKDPIKDWSDQLYMKMTSVSQSESTTYEVHFTGKRASGKQALMRLIVRGCEQDKWNAPCCDKTCPVCFNGGVCETRIGVCVCPPGFSGNFCEILLGPDRFGQDGSFQCSSDKLPGKTCEGKLFCLPDPYGCSCASGYKGIDCDEGCPDGSFGASCLQTCHCMDNAPCNKTTGRCPGNCASGFKGINCQDLCPEGYGGLAGNCSTRCTAPAEVTEFQDDTPLNLSANQIHLSWKFVSNRCAVMRYQVQYELTNLEQCQPMEPNRIDVEGDSYYGDSLIISSDVLPYSSYTVYVSAWNEMEKGPETSIDLCTGESVPSLAPVLTGSNISSESITFNWEPIPCGSRGGDITGYIYEVQDSTGTMVVDSQSVSVEMAVVVGLTPCTIYSFKVQAETSKGPGPWTEDMEVETSAVVPEMVNQLTVSGTPVPTEIQVAWQKPTNTGNCTVQYTVEYALINRDLCEGFPSPSRILWPTGTLSAMTITGVYPNSIYRVFVTASTIAGLGTKLWDEAVTQGTAPSGPPSNVSLSNFTLNTLSFAWDLPLCGQRNGNITHYRYNLTGIASRQTEQANISQASIEFMGLVPFTPYVLTVFAINIFGSGPVATIAVQTGAPSEPGSLSVSTVSETSVTLEWRPPLFPNGKVFKYKIDQRVVARPYNDSFTFDADSKYESQEIPDESMTSSTVYNLEPSTEYEFLVYIVTSTNVVGKKAKVESFTAPATGMTPPEKPTLSGKGQSSTSSITIQLASTTPSKYVTSYQVGVKNTKAGVDTNRRSAGSGLEFGHFTESPTSYVAAELPRRLPDVFVVGDDREYDGYFNPSLQEGASYEIYFGAVSRISDKEFSVVWNEDPLVVQVAGGLSSSRQGIGLTVGVAVAMSMLAAVALVLALVVIWKRHQRSVGKEDGPFRAPSELSLHSIHGKDQNISPLSPDSDTPPARPQEKLGPTANKKPAHSHLEDPVALSNLANHIKSKKSRNGFQQEYETLPVTPLHPWTVAKKSHNMKKNRYTNIVAYDHSRVVLRCPDDSPHSDYINASYINGYKQEAQYIACQGPTKASVVDMWRMLWQEQVGIIVMLTNLVENGKVKCEKYWPDSLQKYADFTVTNISEEVLTNYVVRTFHLSKYSDPEGVFRELNHFHYTTWPDMKPPESSSLLQFVRRVQAAETTQPGPMVVHCSAGVGRTGTFITLDSMLTQAQAEGQVGVFNFVHAMREQRIMMVQTVDQYKFIFDALLESCLTENTAIPVARLQQDYAKLKKRDRKTGTTGIEEQFKMLETFTATYTEDKCRGGLESANVAKNRFPNFIPADKIRPYLMTPGEEGSTNYINAVFLDGYNKKSAYLATQSPLPNTLGDIWRMVFDYNSSCIVMLNSVDSDRNVPQYWPDEGSLQFGRLTVTFRNIDHQSDTVIVRQFGIRSSEKKSDKEQSICHIQYLAWPSGKEVPNSPSSLLKVLETVKIWTNDHPDEPVTVHCIDGLGCSGTLCALMTVLESVSQEQVVDVFQAVKKLRAARAGLVQTLAQYQLLYQLTQTSLDSNSIYENLR